MGSDRSETGEMAGGRHRIDRVGGGRYGLDNAAGGTVSAILLERYTRKVKFF